MTVAVDALSSGFETRSARWLFWQRFKEDRAALGAAAVIILLVLIAIAGGPLAQLITGHPNNGLYTAQMENEFGAAISLSGPHQRTVRRTDGPTAEKLRGLGGVGRRGDVFRRQCRLV